jgi:hypothetical protein
MSDRKPGRLDLLQTVAMTLAFAGAIASLYFMFKAGRNQRSFLIIAFFTAWVLSPYAGLFLAAKTSNRRFVPIRALIYWLMIILAIGSVVAYSGILTPSGTKGAFIFLVAPFISWIVIAILILIGGRHTTKS